MVKGLVLNEISETGTVTYPAGILNHIEDEVKSLNWRITNAVCLSDGTGYEFPFNDCVDCIMDGTQLLQLLNAHPDIQWVWGVLSGFPKTVDLQQIHKRPVFDQQAEQPYLQHYIHHTEPEAVLELVAFDSTETYILADSDELISRLVKEYPASEDLVKYVITDKCISCSWKQKEQGPFSCPECGCETLMGELDGPTLSLNCQSCGYAVAGTSFWPPCHLDNDKYSIAVMQVQKERLIKTAKLLELNVVQLKKLLEEGRMVSVQDMSLFEVAQLMIQLNNLGVSYSVSPNPICDYSELLTCELR